METIDLTPTWGEIGLLYVRLAESGETKALTEMRGEVARAFAASQALTAIMGDLPAELRDRARIIIGEELAKQGFPGDRPPSDSGDAGHFHAAGLQHLHDDDLAHRAGDAGAVDRGIATKAIEQAFGGKPAPIMLDEAWEWDRAAKKQAGENGEQ